MGNYSPMAQWEEYLAKYLIEDFFTYGLLKKEESPDLQGEEVGIEVVKAYDPWYNISEGEFEKSCFSQDSEKHKRKSVIINATIPGIEKNKNLIASTGFCKTKFGEVRFGYACGDLYNSRKPLIENSVKKKLEKLNSKHYKVFPQMGLFIFSLIELSENSIDCSVSKKDDLLLLFQSILKEYNTSHNDSRVFQFIILYSPPCATLMHFDLEKSAVRQFNINMYKYQQRLNNLSKNPISESEAQIQ